MLANQYLTYKQQYEDALQALKDGEAGISQEMVDEYKRLYETSDKELQKFVENSGEAGSEQASEMIKELGSNEYAWYLKNYQFGDAGIDGFLKAVDTRNPGNQYVAGMINAIADQEGPFQDQLRQLAKSGVFTIQDEWDEHSPSRVGYKLAKFFVKPMGTAFSDGKEDIVNEAKSVANAITDVFDNSLSVDPFADLKNQKLNLGNIPRARAAIGAATSVSTTNSIINNNNSSTNKTFVQNNYSPKALSRLDIYRQTKTLFKAAERT